MSAILHVSDMHFGTTVPKVMQALFAFTETLAPDLVVVSGDLTQRAKPSEFAAARAFVDRLPARHKLAIPGNHDIPLFDLWARALHPYRNYCRYFGSELEPTVELADVLVLGVNTTRNWMHKDGRVSAEQIARVQRALARAPADRLRVVVTHQPIWVSRPQDAKDRLHNHQAALEAWAHAGADVLLGGHIHLPYLRDLATCVPGLSRNVWCVQAGTATSSRVRWDAPNSLNLLRFPAPVAAGEPPAVVTERWDYDASLERFERTESIEMPLSRRSRVGGA